MTHEGPPQVKEACLKPCKDCPFKRTAMKGWLGSYAGPEEFIGTHYRQDQPNPCHMTVDYERPDWKDKVADAVGCAGQQIMYVNGGKLPKFWKLDPRIQADRDAVFSFPHEFIKYHTLSAAEKPTPPDAPMCGLCKSEIVDLDPDDVFCHGCKTNICIECDVNHNLMGPHEAIEHQDDSLDEEVW